jgi:hypothetical protein
VIDFLSNSTATTTAIFLRENRRQRAAFQGRLVFGDVEFDDYYPVEELEFIVGRFQNSYGTFQAAPTLQEAV